jgi:acetylornithine deacetylase
MKEHAVTALLRELIRIPSVSSLSNRPLVEFVEGILGPRGWHMRELPYRDQNGIEKLNLIAVPAHQSAEDLSVDLAFVCHTDTVPYSPGWKQAVEPELQDGALHGCGACDVKGFLACLLAATTRISAKQLVHSVALVLTAEEEIGCIGSQNLLATGLLKARHVVVGEPTSLHPARAGKSYNLARIRVLGKEAHSAHPTQGASAIYRAAHLIEGIETLANSLQHASTDETSRIFDPPYTTLNIGMIEGGTAKNIVPGECGFLLEWRAVPGETSGLVIPAVMRLIEELQLNDAAGSCEVEVLREQAGFETAAGSPLLRRWEQLSGRAAIGVSFGTEAPLMNALTDDVIVVGPGDMRTAHSERECVPVEDLDLCVTYFRELMTHPLERRR